MLTLALLPPLLSMLYIGYIEMYFFTGNAFEKSVHSRLTECLMQ